MTKNKGGTAQLRWMPDNSLVTEQGWKLREGEWLSRDDAQRLLAGRRVLVHSHHAPTEDVTGDAARIARILDEFTSDGELFKYTGSLYSDGTNEVFVFQWHH